MRTRPTQLVLYICVAVGSAISGPPRAIAESPAVTPAPITIAVFDTDGADPANAFTAESCDVTIDTVAPFEGAGALRITTPDPMAVVARVTIPLPAGVDLLKCRALSAALRTTPVTGGVRLRWYALRADGSPAFQRRFDVDEGAIWSRIEFPLALWRWHTGSVGDWTAVTSLRLDIESRVAHVWVDSLRLEPGVAAHDGAWLRQVAFGASPSRVIERDGLWIGTDAMDKATGASIDRLIARLSKIGPWLERVFGDAHRPVATSSPVALALFANEGDYRLFFDRLGAAWRVSIARPLAAGYAVQDIGASSLDSDRSIGAERPVILHEMTHAIVARRLRLATGTPGTDWLQEAIANYLQLALHPASFDSASWSGHFARAIDPAGNSFFKPLADLLPGKVTLANYAQIASLLAWLIETQPTWLAPIASGAAAGTPLADTLKELGSDIAAMESAWQTWGRARWPTGSSPATHWPIPQEWVA
jgi:hypothetical protein